MVTLRPARPDDRDFYWEARRDGFRTYVEQTFGPWHDEPQRAFADKDFDELPVEIIEREGEAIGYQMIVRHPDHWYLDEIAIVAAARGLGIGTELVKAMMEDARAAGVPVRLSVLEVNPAQRLYARLGFRVTRVEHPRVKMEWP